jgi:hypothetical protein
LTVLRKKREFHISVKALLAESTNKSVVAMFAVNFAHRESNQTPMFKTVHQQNAMLVLALVPLLISRQLVVVHRHRLKSVVQTPMQHAHAVTKHNPTVLLVKQNGVQPLIVSQQIVLIIHHQHDELTLLPEWKQPVDRRKALPMLLPVQDKLIHADQQVQMTGEVQTEQTVQHRTEWVTLRNEFKQTVV